MDHQIFNSQASKKLKLATVVERLRKRIDGSSSDIKDQPKGNINSSDDNGNLPQDEVKANSTLDPTCCEKANSTSNKKKQEKPIHKEAIAEEVPIEMVTCPAADFLEDKSVEQFEIPHENKNLKLTDYEVVDRIIRAIQHNDCDMEEFEGIKRWFSNAEKQTLDNPVKTEVTRQNNVDPYRKQTRSMTRAIKRASAASIAAQPVVAPSRASSSSNSTISGVDSDSDQGNQNDIKRAFVTGVSRTSQKSLEEFDYGTVSQVASDYMQKLFKK